MNKAIFLLAMAMAMACGPAAAREASADTSTLADAAPGTWVGFGTCGANEVTFTIAIQKTADGYVAEAGGAFAPITLAGSIQDDAQTALLRATAWRGEDLSRQTAQFDLELTYLPHAKMLSVTRIGVESECRNLVARKIPTPASRPNPKGLLFKTAALTEGDCATYARWLVARYKAREGIEAAFTTHPALYDPKGMVRILGRDFLSWTDEDAIRIKSIGGACQTKLKDVRGTETAAAARYLDDAGWTGAPLTYLPSVPVSRLWYGPALRALYTDMIDDMQIDRYRLSEGLDGGGLSPAQARYGDRRARLTATPRNTFTGEWFGGISCGTSAGTAPVERLIRVLVDSNRAEVQLGPYEGAYTGSVAAVDMSATYDPQTHAVSIRKTAKSIEGTYDPETGRLTGVAAGLTDLSAGACKDVTLHKVERAAASKNPDGLLFQVALNPYGGVAAHRLTPDQCTGFFRWQSAYKTYKTGNSMLSVYGGLFDAAGMRAVFGKDIIQWDDVDAARIGGIRHACRDVILKDKDPERLAVMNRVDPDTWFGWAILETWPRRVRAGGQIEISADWFRVERLMRDIATEQKL